MEIEVECPSGLKGKIHSLKVKDEVVVTDAKLLKQGGLVYELCKRCWFETTDPGPYAFEGDFDWSKAMQGDAFWVFLQIRRITYGDEYSFSITCKQCRTKVDEDILISEKLQMEPMSEEGLEAFKTNQPLEIRMDDGRMVRFKILSAEDDKRIKRIESGRGLETRHAILAARLVEVEGIDPHGVNNIRFVEDLDAGTADDLLGQMEQYDGGVDTDLTITCPECYADNEVMLPLEMSFFRKRNRKKDRRERRKRSEEQGG